MQACHTPVQRKQEYGVPRLRKLHLISTSPDGLLLLTLPLPKALMTSPPDPSLPKPPFCAKLNWGTSPAFTLRWLATTPVHFRHVGHLKNELNRDEEGKAMAVLVGKDGQEISAEAGMGLVWILDEAQEVEGGKERGKGGMKW